MGGERIHPRRTGDPLTVRWVGVELGGVGTVTSCPGALGEWLASGRITAITAELHSVWVSLARDEWAEVGGQVHEMLVEVQHHVGEIGFATDAHLLERVTDDVLNSSLASYIASHGGDIRILDTDGDHVRLDMGGACKHCAAATLTMHGRIQSELRSRLGEHIHVTSDEEHESIWNRFRLRGRATTV